MDSIDCLWILGYFLVILGGIYRFFVSEFDYFLDQGISGPLPAPVFGTWWKQWNEKLPEVQLERYQKYGRIFGTFDGKTPNTFVADPKLLRKILIHDFDNFVNRVPMIDMKDKYANSMLISLKDYKWKDTRNALTPIFTSEKIKQMRGLTIECVENLMKYLKDQSDSRFRKLDLRSLMTSYTLDVIGSCGFGSKIDTLQNPDDPFVKNAARLFKNDGVNTNPIVLLFALYPFFGKLLPRRVFKQVHFFAKTARVMYEQRRIDAKLNLEKRNDFMNMMSAETSDSSIVLNPLKNEIIFSAQILQFLLAGTDTTSSVLTNLLYNLALNEDIQNKLRQEILKVSKGEDIDVETVTELPYLQQCISETLRLYPPVLTIDRQCNKTTSYEGLRIQKGTFITVPIYAIHQDPEFYPNPQMFDPERFSPAEVSKRDPMTYLPFGEGPRACIGAKFALEEIKILVSHLLSQFKFRRTIETPEILEFIPGIIPVYQSTKILVSFDKLCSAA